MSTDNSKDNRSALLLGLTSITFLGLAGAVLGYFWKLLPPEIPWFYSLPWGEAQLIPKSWFGVGLGVVLVINLGNLFLAKFLSKTDRIVANGVAGANLLVTALYLISLAKVVTIII